MGTPTVSNIIKSGATIYVAPVGEPWPDPTAVKYGDPWPGNWERIGFTKEKTALAYEDETFDITVDEVLAPVRRTRTGEKATLETVLAETTADYLHLVTGEQDEVTVVSAGAGQRGYEEVGIGDVSIIPERQWAIEGMYLADDGSEYPVRVYIHRGTAKLNGTLEFSRKGNDYTGIPLQVEALADLSKPRGKRLIVFQRITQKATDE